MFDFLRIPQIPTPTIHEEVDDLVAPAPPEPPAAPPEPPAEEPPVTATTVATSGPSVDALELSLEDIPELRLSDLIHSEIVTLDEEEEALKSIDALLHDLCGDARMDCEFLARAIDDEIAAFVEEKRAELAAATALVDALETSTVAFSKELRRILKARARRRQKLAKMLD